MSRPNIRKLLVANRGEIACRIFRTAARLGIPTVAVHSDADARAMHVAMADEAVRIGPAEASRSYLSVEAILDACRRTGADAVHPGYGFLSERAAFAEALAAAGILFIGPNPAAIAAMGDKIGSKKVAAGAGVSTVPGFLGVIEDAAHAARIAGEIGYPVMLKASAGGGGKGMRVARSAEEVADGFARARSEAASSFGDDRVFLEKFVENPRHIEIQVVGDKHGHVVHLGERECSIQRRNQKVLEEAPSPFLDEGMRAAMGAQAVTLARAVGYDSAGTVEFVVGQDRGFYFLEMNTRLQVEHPVTELVTGLDLVELMIRSAVGEPLPLRQDDLRLSGWAVESRIYAEDPRNGFLPSTGRISTLAPPAEGPAPGGATLRIDRGVRQGDEVPVFYDPMIGKLISHGPDRAAAIAAQIGALDAFAVDGITTNLPFLATLMRHPRWQEGRLSTRFIEDEFPAGFGERAAPPGLALRMAAVAASLDVERELAARRRAGRVDEVPFTRVRSVRAGGREQAIEIAVTGGGRVIARHGQDTFALERRSARLAPVWQGLVGGEAESHRLKPLPSGEVAALHAGCELRLRVLPPRAAALAGAMPPPAASGHGDEIRAPMPGLVVSVFVEPGTRLVAGDPVAVVEAMKVEVTLRAEREGVVTAVHVSQGSLVAVDHLIATYRASGGDAA